MAFFKNVKDAASDGTDDFQHTELGPDEIRLLKVHLQNDSATLSLTVERFPRSEAPPFSAISYTWGDRPHKHKTLLLNERPFKATQNAFWCLYFICKHYRRWEYLWMDGLCIDQTNLAERNAQVQRMDWIYQNASTVLTWLGSDREIRWNAWSTNFGKYKSDKTYWYDSPYWHRIWVLQEVFHAREVLFLYGPEEINSRALEGFLSEPFVQTCIKFLEVETANLVAAQSAKPERLVNEQRPSSIMSTFSLVHKDSHEVSSLPSKGCKKKKGQQGISLLTSLEQFQYHACSDVRDRVFAILTFLPATEKKALYKYFPDYGLSTPKFWLIVLAHLVLWHGASRKCMRLIRNYFGLDFRGQYLGECPQGMEHVAAAILPLINRASYKLHYSAPLLSFKGKELLELERLAHDEMVNRELRDREALMHRLIGGFVW